MCVPGVARKSAANEAPGYSEGGHGLRRAADRCPQGLRKAIVISRNQSPAPVAAKKYSESLDVWQGQGDERLTVLLQNRGFIEDDEYVILSIIPHPK
jgi:hypothetical protein